MFEKRLPLYRFLFPGRGKRKRYRERMEMSKRFRKEKVISRWERKIFFEERDLDRGGGKKRIGRRGMVQCDTEER